MSPASKVAVMFVMLALFPWSGAFADDEGQRLFENWKANVTANVNLRRSPSLGSDVVVRLNTNDPVLIRGIKGDWFQVIAETGNNAHKGWVHGHYVRKAATTGPEPAVDTPAQPTEQAQPTGPALPQPPAPETVPVPLAPAMVAVPVPVPLTVQPADPKASEPAQIQAPAQEASSTPAPEANNDKVFEFATDIPVVAPELEQAGFADILRLTLRFAALALAATAFLMSQRQVRLARAAAC